jgi:UDPglucose 6-dehydrogenase
MTIGFIGQGWIGKNYADSFEDRGFSVVRYAKEEPFVENKKRIAECDMVFIAVPTPTTPEGFNVDAVRSALSCVGKGKIAVIKSTILPGTTRMLQQECRDITVLCSPEFLREASARHDVDNPDRNIIGITSDAQRTAAEEVMRVLPPSPYTIICLAEEAELTKYAGNVFLYMKVVYMNMLYDLASSLGADWETIAKNLSADPRIGSSHMHPMHASGHTKVAGRGAGGHCFIKDFAAFSQLYRARLQDGFGNDVLAALERKNNELLCESGKDIDLLDEVYDRKEHH